MNIVKRYARAVISSNLKCDEWDRDINVLMAMALCRVPIGALAIRAKIANDLGALRQLKAGIREIIAKLAFIESWPDEIKVSVVTAVAIDYWFNDVCPECYGRKSDQIDNTPCLSGVDCSVCEGSGKRVVPCSEQQKKYVMRMVYSIDESMLHARNSSAKMLGGE